MWRSVWGLCGYEGSQVCKISLTPIPPLLHAHHNVVHCSSFARFPDGRIEHYFCAKDKLVPEQDKDTPKPYDTNPF